MEEKKDIKGVLLVVFIILSLLLGGFIVYDKLLKNDDAEGCEKPVCQCDTEKKMTLASKYVNEGESLSYLEFDTVNSTWKGVRNHCEGYEDVSGTYVIENNKLTLNNENFVSDGGVVTFELITDSSNKVIRLHDLTGDDSKGEIMFHYTGCSSSEYYKAE